MTKKKNKTMRRLPLPGWLASWQWQALGLGLLGFLLYVNTLGHGYAQDDAIVITENAFTQKGIKGLPGIFSNDTFFGFFQDKSKARLVTGGRYRPLSVATFALEQSLWGQQPGLSHLLNALIYGGLCALLFITLRLSLSSFPEWEKAVFPLIITLLFTTHPVHTEAVANIKGRDEILALLCAVWAWNLSLRALDKANWVLQVLGALVLFLGMLSKENAFTFVGIIPMVWFVFRQKPLVDIWLPALTYAVAGCVFLVIRSAVLPDAQGGPSMELMNNPFLVLENGRYEVMTFSERLPTVLYTWGRYLQLLFAPVVLTHDYYPRHIELQTYGDPVVIWSAVSFLVLIGMAFRGMLKRGPMAFGIAFFLVTFLPVSNLLFPIGTNMAERLLFMPSLGWAIAVGWLLVRLGQWIPGKNDKHEHLKWLGPMVMGVLVIGTVFSARTIARNKAWKDNYTLFTTDIQVSEQSAKLQNAVGGELLARSVTLADPVEQKALRERAVGHLNKAVAIHPLYKNAYLLLGNAHNYLLQYEASIANYRKALQLDPGYEEARSNLAITLRQAGQYYGEQLGDLNQAIRYLEQARQLTPNEYEVLRLLGVAHGVGGQHERAAYYFQQAVNVQPESAMAWFNLAQALEYKGDPVGAQQAWQKALQIDPDIRDKMRNQ